MSLDRIELRNRMLENRNRLSSVFFQSIVTDSKLRLIGREFRERCFFTFPPFGHFFACQNFLFPLLSLHQFRFPLLVFLQILNGFFEKKNLLSGTRSFFLLIMNKNTGKTHEFQTNRQSKKYVITDFRAMAPSKQHLIRLTATCYSDHR